MPLDYKALCAPFPPEEVEWRVGSTTQDKKKGMALAYIDARAVMDRLDQVCGPYGWQCRYPIANGKTCCEIGIKAGDEWIWKSDGAGDTDFEGAKGAFSDAFKRAAVRWGIGRYLYDIKAPWVQIEQRGKSYIIAKHELATLRKCLEGETPQGSPPSNSHDPNWKGPLTKTELASELRAFAALLDGECETSESVNALVGEYSAILEQGRHDMPEWTTTGTGSPEFVPLEERIKRKLETLSGDF